MWQIFDHSHFNGTDGSKHLESVSGSSGEGVKEEERRWVCKINDLATNCVWSSVLS